MSEKEREAPRPEPVADGDAKEPFLSRWSRLKADNELQARESRPPAAPPGSVPDDTAPAEGESAEAGAERLSPGDEDMPPIESLDENADVSAFFSPRVSGALRKQALRKLFRGPKFNVIDLLDDYIDDYRNFPPLGDIVTADMKHAAERLLKMQEEAEAAKAEAETEAEAKAGRATQAPDAGVEAEGEIDAPGVEATARGAPDAEGAPEDPRTHQPKKSEDPERDA